MNDSIYTHPVSALIPTYNGKKLLQKHLPAVLACLRPGDEVVIVDDCSSDDTLEYLQTTYGLKETEHATIWRGNSVSTKQVAMVLVKTPKNGRFAAACNLGIQVASHRYVFLLNNDVSPQEDALEYLLPHFSDAQCFAVGCLEYEQDLHGETSGKNKLWFERGRFIHAKADTMSSGETAWVSGGSGLFDREKWILLGGLDKRFFPAYWEDIDLSYRARTRGWKVLFEKKAVVFHKHESTNTSVFGLRAIAKMSFRNGTQFTLKHATLRQYIQHFLWKPYWFLRAFWLIF